jgi:integral membrane protein
MAQKDRAQGRQVGLFRRGRGEIGGVAQGWVGVEEASMRTDDWKVAVGRLRAVGMLEGLSFLALLGVAMPLKHLYGMPLPVKIVGWTHGLLFVSYLVVLVQVAQAYKWPLSRVLVGAVAAALPGGPFLIDSRLVRWAQQGPASGSDVPAQNPVG